MESEEPEPRYWINFLLILLILSLQLDELEHTFSHPDPIATIFCTAGDIPDNEEEWSDTYYYKARFVLPVFRSGSDVLRMTLQKIPMKPVAQAHAFMPQTYRRTHIVCCVFLI